MAAGALLFDEAGGLLIVKPSPTALLSAGIALDVNGRASSAAMVDATGLDALVGSPS